MQNYNSKANWQRNWNRLMLLVGACAFILLVGAGARVLTGCASTPKGVAREQQLYLVSSNAVSGLSALAPYAPAPVGTLLEGITAVGGALLAVWASHLHRSVRALETGSGKGTATAAAGPQTPPQLPGNS